MRTFQQKNGLDVDGMAGPDTLAKMSLFAEMTPDVVAKSRVPAGGAPSAAPPASAPKRSIWGTIKGLF
jgi:hypothetical protein